jgi:anti-sigma regulatory factor (Ser/Thr protein kinase)
MPESSRTFAAASSAVGDARRFLREVLSEWGEDGFDFGAPLVLTELVTNAVLHARTPYDVRVSLDGGHLAIEVRDCNSHLPRQRHYRRDATTGRGLLLVSELCSDWGVREVDDGKVVWAHVRPDAAAALEPDLRRDAQHGEPAPA